MRSATDPILVCAVKEMKKQIFASGFAAAVAANPALAEETNDPHRISKGSVFPPQLCWALAAMLRHRALAATAASLMLFASQAGGQERVHRVGVLAQSEIPEQTEAWPRGLREHGWVVGRNLQIEYRDYYDRPELIPALAAELDALRPDVIVTSGPLPALAVHSAAPVIPLVFLVVADPIALGLVDSLARPGGSATGMATNVPEGFVGKKLQLLKELVPRASRIAVLINPMNPIHQHFRPELPEISSSRPSMPQVSRAPRRLIFRVIRTCSFAPWRSWRLSHVLGYRQFTPSARMYWTVD